MRFLRWLCEVERDWLRSSELTVEQLRTKRSQIVKPQDQISPRLIWWALSTVPARKQPRGRPRTRWCDCIVTKCIGADSELAEQWVCWKHELFRYLLPRAAASRPFRELKRMLKWIRWSCFYGALLIIYRSIFHSHLEPLCLIHFVDPCILPKQQVDRGAIKFVLSGANVMCPGLTSKGAKLTNGCAVNQAVVRSALFPTVTHAALVT